MKRYIDADYLDTLLTQLVKEGRHITRNDYKIIDNILFEFPTADVVDVVRCKDCIHRPTDTGGHNYGRDMEFPDDICPCKVEDHWYSWMPKDNWFCGNGERRDDAEIH